MLGRHQSSERYVEVPMDALEDEVARHLGDAHVHGQRHVVCPLEQLHVLASLAERVHEWRARKHVARNPGDATGNDVPSVLSLCQTLRATTNRLSETKNSPNFLIFENCAITSFRDDAPSTRVPAYGSKDIGDIKLFRISPS
jgi:hypothetical protein